MSGFSVRNINMDNTEITPREMLSQTINVSDIPDEDCGYFITSKGTLFAWAKGTFNPIEPEGKYIIMFGDMSMRY